jgi:hypothetical protein
MLGMLTHCGRKHKSPLWALLSEYAVAALKTGLWHMVQPING